MTQGLDNNGNVILSAAFATRIVIDGSVTYVAEAEPGTVYAAAAWRAKKIDATDANDTQITWADRGRFTQVATDLTALTYS